MKSSDFCLMWDNLFVPADLIINKPEKQKKEIFLPRFCQTRALTSEDIEILWEFKSLEAEKHQKQAMAARERRKSRVSPRRGARRGGAAGKKGMAPEAVEDLEEVEVGEH